MEPSQKPTTPMQRVRGPLQEFSSYMETYFRSFILNKSKAKNEWANGVMHRSKGVESDFLKGYKLNGQFMSLAFDFRYEGLPVDKQVVYANIKKGKDNSSIQVSTVMSIAEFKQRLIDFNKWASAEKENNTLSAVAMVKKFSLVFLQETLELTKELKAQQEELQTIRTQKSQELSLDKIEKKYEKSKNAWQAAIVQQQKELQDSKEYREHEKSLKKLKEDAAALERLRVDLSRKYDLEVLREEFIKSTVDLDTAQKTLTLQLKQYQQGVEPIVAKKLKIR